MADHLDVLGQELRGPCQTLLEKLGLRSSVESELVRDFLLRLMTEPFVLRPATRAIESQVCAAIFWHECQKVHLICGTEEQVISKRDRIDRDFEEHCMEPSPFHILSTEFWTMLGALANDDFLSVLAQKLTRNFAVELHPSLVHQLTLAVASFVDFAITSHIDSELLRRGQRFLVFFDLYFNGTPIIAYDTNAHEATVLVAHGPVN